MSAKLSYVHGAIGTALIGETIGAAFDRTVARYGDCHALTVRAAGGPLDLSRAGRTGRCVRRGAAGARFRARRAGRDLGAELRRMGRDAIRDREGRADPGQHQPGLSPRRAGIRAEQGRRRRHRHRDRVQDQRLCRHAECAGAGTGERGAGAAPSRKAAASAQRDPDRRPERAGHGRVRRCRGDGRGPRSARVSRNWPSGCNSTIRSTSSSRRARPARRRARR